MKIAQTTIKFLHKTQNIDSIDFRNVQREIDFFYMKQGTTSLEKVHFPQRLFSS